VEDFGKYHALLLLLLSLFVVGQVLHLILQILALEETGTAGPVFLLLVRVFPP